MRTTVCPGIAWLIFTAGLVGCVWPPKRREVAKGNVWLDGNLSFRDPDRHMHVLPLPASDRATITANRAAVIWYDPSDPDDASIHAPPHVPIAFVVVTGVGLVLMLIVGIVYVRMVSRRMPKNADDAVAGMGS